MKLQERLNKNLLIQQLLIYRRSKFMFLSIDILEKIFLLSSPLLWVHACASILFVLAGIIVAYLYTNATRYYATEDMVCGETKIAIPHLYYLSIISMKMKSRKKK